MDEYRGSEAGERTAEDESTALLIGARAFVGATLAMGEPAWFGRILRHALLELPPETLEVLRETRAPLDAALRRLARRYKPELSAAEVQVMISGGYAKVHSTLVTSPLVLQGLGREPLDDDDFTALARDVARGVTVTLGLPDPDAT